MVSTRLPTRVRLLTETPMMVFHISMGAVWLWARATTRRAFGGLLLIAVLAGFSGAAALIALVGAHRTRSSLERAVAAYDPGVIDLQSSDPRAFDGLQDVPGVRLALPFETFLGGVGASGTNFLLYMSPRPFGTSVDRIEPIRGRLPVGAGEVLLTEQAAAAQHLDVGDTLSFESVSWAQLNAPDGPTGTEAAPGPVVSLKVVGTGSTLIQKVQPDDAVGWVAEEFAARYDTEIAHLGGVDGIGLVDFVWVDGGEASIASVQQAMSDVNPPVGFSRFSTFSEPARAATETMASGVLVLAIALAIAGTGGTAVTVLRHLARFRGDHSALEALGMTRKRRAMLGVVSVAPAAAAAGIVTVVVTLASSRLMPFGAVARRLDPDVGTRPSIWILAVGGLAVVAVVAGVSFLGAWLRAARREQRPSGLATWLTSGPLGRWPTVTTGVGFAVDGRASNQPGAVRAALAAGVLGVAGVAGGLSVMNALDGLHDSPARWGFTWSVMIDDGDTAADDAQELLDTPDIDAAVSGWAISSNAPATINGVDVRADALDVHSGPIVPQIRRGRAPTSPSEVVLSASLADDLGVSIGDTVTAITDAGPVDLSVVGEATLYPVKSGLLRVPAVLLTPAGQSKVARDRTEFRIAFLAAEGVSAEALYERLSAVLGDGMPSRTDALAVAPSEVKSAVQLEGVALALALFTGALGVVLVANAVFVTPRRRGRDLAVLRALGTASAQTARVIGIQAATISFVSLAVGIPVGLIAGHLAFASIANHAGADAGQVVAWSVLALVVGAVVVVTPLIAVWPAWRAARQRPATVLRGE